MPYSFEPDKNQTTLSCDDYIEQLTVNLINNGESLNSTDSKTNIPLLHSAVIRKNFDAVTAMTSFLLSGTSLEHYLQLDINHVDELGDTALHIACNQECTRFDSTEFNIIKELLSKNANYEQQNRAGKTAIDLLCDNRQKNMSLRQRVLLYACDKGYPSIVTKLLACTTDIDISIDGMNPFNLAAKANATEILGELLNHIVSPVPNPDNNAYIERLVNANTSMSQTSPIHSAAFNLNLPMIIKLLVMKAHINALDKYNITPFMKLFEGQQLDKDKINHLKDCITTFFNNTNFNPLINFSSMTFRIQDTAIHLLIKQSNSIEILNLVLGKLDELPISDYCPHHPYPLTHQNDMGDTPLHLEAKKSHPDAEIIRALTKSLIKHYTNNKPGLIAALQLQNKLGNSVLHLLINHGDLELIQSFLNELDENTIVELIAQRNKESRNCLLITVNNDRIIDQPDKQFIIPQIFEQLLNYITRSTLTDQKKKEIIDTKDKISKNGKTTEYTALHYAVFNLLKCANYKSKIRTPDIGQTTPQIHPVYHKIYNLLLSNHASVDPSLESDLLKCRRLVSGSHLSKIMGSHDAVHPPLATTGKPFSAIPPLSRRPSINNPNLPASATPSGFRPSSQTRIEGSGAVSPPLHTPRGDGKLSLSPDSRVVVTHERQITEESSAGSSDRTEQTRPVESAHHSAGGERQPISESQAASLIISAAHSAASGNASPHAPVSSEVVTQPPVTSSGIADPGDPGSSAATILPAVANSGTAVTPGSSAAATQPTIASSGAASPHAPDTGATSSSPAVDAGNNMITRPATFPLDANLAGNNQNKSRLARINQHFSKYKSLYLYYGVGTLIILALCGALAVCAFWPPISTIVLPLVSKGIVFCLAKSASYAPVWLKPAAQALITTEPVAMAVITAITIGVAKGLYNAGKNIVNFFKSPQQYESSVKRSLSSSSAQDQSLNTERKQLPQPSSAEPNHSYSRVFSALNCIAAPLTTLFKNIGSITGDTMPANNKKDPDLENALAEQNKLLNASAEDKQLNRNYFYTLFSCCSSANEIDPPATAKVDPRAAAIPNRFPESPSI